MIVYSEQYGIEIIQEGRFFEGDIIGLGRSHAMELSVPSPNYKSEQHYTGWHPFPQSELPDFVGNGIAVIDKKKVV